MGVVLTVITVASFVWSLMLADSDPARGFFVTTTRAWELGIGAAVALAVPLLGKLPARIAGWLAFFGLAVIIASLVVSNQEMAWPGSAARLPVLGTAAVIAAGVSNADSWTARLLSVKPMVWIGGLSYSLYLWHWPLLVFAEQYRGYLGVKGGVLISIGAVIPAYVSQRLIENPIRFSRTRLADRGRMLLLGALLISVGIGSGLAVVASSPRTEIGEVADGGGAYQLLGARALGENPLTSPAGFADAPVHTIYPAPADAPDDIPISYELGCQAAVEDVEPMVCEVGDAGGDVRILVTGDSKMLQYYGVLDEIGKEYNWSIEIATKSSCSWIAAVPLIEERPYAECFEFGERVTRHLERTKPDYVLTSGGAFRLANLEETSDEDRAEALVDRWMDAQAAGAEVIVLLENPYPVGAVPVYGCVERKPESLTECAFDREAGVARSAAPAQVIASQNLTGVAVISVNDYICPQGLCSPVIGNTLIYRQGSHLTNTYAMSLEGILGDRLADVIVDGKSLAGPVPTR